MNVWLQNAALWLWQNSLAAAVLAVLVLGVRQVFRGRISPRWLYLAGWLVMLRLFLPAPLTHPWAWDRAWAQADSTSSETAVVPLLTNVPASEITSTVPQLRAEIAAARSTLYAMRASGMGSLHPKVITAGSALTAREQVLAEVAESTPSAKVNWLAVVVWIWIGGAAAYLLYTLVSHVRFLRRLQRRAVPLEHGRDALSGLMTDCAAATRLRRLPRLLTIPGNGSPFLCGLFRPCIVLPEATLAVLTSAELRHVLLHEMLHISRRDLAANWLLAVIRALHWWNPLVHAAARRLLADREILRDQQAINLLREPAQRAAYGHTLLKLALPLSAPAPTPGLAPLFHSEKELKRRLTMIQSPIRHRRLTACVAAGVLSILCAPLFTTARGQEKPKPENKPLPPPAAPVVASQPFRGVKLAADRVVKNGDTWSGFIGDKKSFQVTEVPAAPQTASDAEKAAVTAWSTKASEAADIANAVRATYDERTGQLIPERQAVADTPPGPLDNLRAVAAKLREKGQAAEADAIEAELKKLAMPAAAAENKTTVHAAPSAPANELQQLRTEMAEMRAALSALQLRSSMGDPSYSLEVAKLELGRAAKAGYGPKHPRVMGLKEVIRLHEQSLAAAIPHAADEAVKLEKLLKDNKPAIEAELKALKARAKPVGK